MKNLSAFSGPAGPDVVQIDWALLERPIGDRFLNQDLWSLANEQVVPFERRDVLEDGGLRIAQLGGLLPAEFQEILSLDRSNPNPRRRVVRAGDAVTLPLGPARLQCRVSGTGESKPDTFTNAQFSVVVTPTLTKDGQTCLHFVPQLQHGQSKPGFKPAKDGSGWTLRDDVPTVTYEQLAWDVTLAPNEYMIAGCWFNRLETWGRECFVRGDEPRPVQRLLAMRTSRRQPDVASDMALDSLEDSSLLKHRPPPLVVQAAGTVGNGGTR
jgi:hypothetical protein